MNQAAASFGPTRPIIPAGTQLNGIYEIDEPIAAGGMGEIYKGHAIQTGDIVAIKLIRPDLAEAEAAFAMFRKEASALHNLHNEAIVRYYVFTIDPALQRPYLAMEYVSGSSLSTMLRGGPLAFEAVMRLMQRIASGLHAAHEQGIVHRDVSPDNIIIPAGDMALAKIIDFGIARSTRLEDDGTVIGTGFAGKYNYVSPEQLGLFGGAVTPKSDIYSLGLVLAEALRGGPIDMGGNHVDVIEKRRVVPDLEGVDERLLPLIEHMLQPNPDDRPASMAAVAAWRHGAPLPRPARPRPPAQAPPAWPGVHFTRTNLILAGAAAAGFIAAATSVYSALHPPPPVVPPPPLLQADGDGGARKAASPGAQTAARAPPAAPVRPGLAPMHLSRLEPEYVAQTAPAPPDAADDAARHRRLDAMSKAIGQYDGGDCFFAAPVTLSDASPAIEGYGASTAPFRGLDQAFREANGYEADIGVRLVAPPQCPAVAFLNALRDTPAAPLKLELAASWLRADQALEGIVSGFGGRDVTIFVVADDGAVRVVPATTQGDTVRFSARPDSGGGRLQLALAVASPKPLPGLRPQQPAAQLFPALIAAVGGNALAVAARSFKVGP